MTLSCELFGGEKSFSYFISTRLSSFPRNHRNTTSKKSFPQTRTRRSGSISFLTLTQRQRSVILIPLYFHRVILRINSEESSLTYRLCLRSSFARFSFLFFTLSVELFFASTLKSSLYKTLNSRFQCQKALGSWQLRRKEEEESCILQESCSTLTQQTISL